VESVEYEFIAAGSVDEDKVWSEEGESEEGESGVVVLVDVVEGDIDAVEAGILLFVVE
jgi:hypothetical protein